MTPLESNMRRVAIGRCKRGCTAFEARSHKVFPMYPSRIPSWQRPSVRSEGLEAFQRIAGPLW